jgi:hypothetical protein
MSALTVPCGFISSASSVANLTLQGATARTSVVDTNFTNTSDVTFQVSYPI